MGYITSEGVAALIAVLVFTAACVWAWYAI